MAADSINLPTELPSIASATLPVFYERAKYALAECSRVDECQEWANKAKALASYAKQAKDDQLQKMAMRIQARAIRRCGELLKQFDARPQNNHQSSADDTLISQREAAKDAGLSKRQQVTAVRVANVPIEKFDAIESDNPPNVSALAEAGKKKRPLVNLEGRDPKEFAMSTNGQAQLRQLAKFAEETDPAAIVRGAMPHERKSMQRHIAVIDDWINKLIVNLLED